MKEKAYNTRLINLVFIIIGLIVVNLCFDLSFVGKKNYEASKLQFAFDFLIMNVAFVLAAVNLKKRKTAYSTCFFVLLFCVYAFWDTDYFSFGRNFYDLEAEYKDILYPILKRFISHNYIIFRLIIWGSALLLFYNTLKRFEIKTNIGTYVFVLFFLTLFSYARASLGMALYFYGLSLILTKKKREEPLTFWAKIAVCFVLAYCAHRSMLIPIILTPIAFVRLNRFWMLIVLVSMPAATVFFQPTLDSLISGGNPESSFVASAQKYSELETAMNYNWKYYLFIVLRSLSFYVAIAVISWKLFVNKLYRAMPTKIMGMFTITLVLLLIASVFYIMMGSKGFGLYIIGYRILFMSGIPICLILAYMYQKGMLRLKPLNIILLVSVAYSELFILGKILSNNIA